MGNILFGGPKGKTVVLLSLIIFTLQVFYISFQPNTKLMQIGGLLTILCKILPLFSLGHSFKIWLIIENLFFSVFLTISPHLKDLT